MKNIPKQYHSAIRKLIKKAVDKERERKITYHKIMGASDWLISNGYEDDHCYTPEDVEDLLQNFINQSLST